MTLTRTRAMALAASVLLGLVPSVAAAADEVLRGVRFQDGAVLTDPDAAWTAREVRKRFDDMVAGRIATGSQSFDRQTGTWSQRMDVTRNPGKRPLGELCLAYAANYLSPNLRPLPPAYKRYELQLTEPESGRSETCGFTIVSRIALVPEGRSGQALRSEKFDTLVLRGGERLHHAQLYETSVLGLDDPITVFAVIVPEGKVASGAFNRTVETAALALLGARLPGHRAVGIVALPQARQAGSYRTPGLAYTAVLDENDDIRLFHQVSIRHLSRVAADGEPDPPLNIFGEVVAPSRALNMIAAEGRMEEIYEIIGEAAPKPLADEAQAFIGLFGGDVADDLGVDRIVVKLRALLPDSDRAFSVSIPFVRRDGEWVEEAKK